MRRSQRSRFRARGRQAILWCLGLFAATNLAWIGVIEFACPACWDLIFAAKFEELRARIHQAPGRPLWLLFGTSKLDHGFRPLMLGAQLSAPDSALFFNFGMPGTDPLRESICLRRLNAAGITPSVIGIEIHGPLLNQKHSAFAAANEQIIWARRDELNLLARHSAAPDEMKRIWWQSRLIPISGSRQIVISNAKNVRNLLFRGVNEERTGRDEAGWRPQPQHFDWPRRYPQHLAAMLRIYEPQWRDFRVTPGADRMLRDLIATCRAQNARVFLYRMPESSDFRAAYPPGALQVIDAYIGHIASEFDLPFIDALTWVEDRGFSDGVHLLNSGAAAFTEKFESAIQTLIQNTPPADAPTEKETEPGKTR